MSVGARREGAIFEPVQSELGRSWRSAAWRLCNDALLALTPDLVTLDANPAALMLFGLDEAEVVRGVPLGRLIDSDSMLLLGSWKEAAKDRPAAVPAVSLITPRARARLADMTAAIEPAAAASGVILCQFSGLAEARAATPPERLGWALEAYALSSSALIHFEDIESLNRNICEAIVSGDVYPLAAVAYADDGPDKRAVFSAVSGRPRAYLDGVDITWHETRVSGRGPFGQAVRNRAPQVMRDMLAEPSFSHWRDRAASFGLRSSVTIPFDRPDGGQGALIVYSSDQSSFGAREIELFTKLAGELAFAMRVAEGREALRRKSEEAEAAARAKGEFLANMSHEIRSPLTAILGFAGILSDMSGMPAAAAPYIDRINASGEALLTIVNDILSFSRIEAGQIDLTPKPFATVEFVEQTLDLVRIEANRKHLGLRSRFAPDLPERIEADPVRLRQVLLNLVSNAVKFTETGAVEVDVAYDHARQSLAVRVSDTGCGVPEAMRDRLFQRFSQIDGSSSRRHSGSGLGLAISRGLIEAMGGRIGMTARKTGGSVFWFEAPAPVAEQETFSPSSPADAGLDPGALRILVVDDSEANRELVRALLTPLGLDLAEAGDGAEGVSLASKSSFDLILMDQQMPVMDGLAATRAIRSPGGANAATPILAFSANVLEKDVEACLRAGMNDHVGKPINPRELLEKIIRWTTPEAA